MKILWDESKSVANRRKHRVSFEEASVLLMSDAVRLEIYDEVHSTIEDRFLAVGPGASGVIVVVYSEPRDDVLRIISARRATRREAEQYRRFVRRAVL